MEPSRPTPEDIRHQMNTIRANVGGEVDGLVVNAQQLVDWRYYLRSYPWASLGVAAALGFAVVPQKPQILRPDKETLAELIKDNKLVMQDLPKARRRSGLAASLVSLTGNMLLRAGIAYIGQNAGKIFGEQAAADAPAEVPHS